MSFLNRTILRWKLGIKFVVFCNEEVVKGPGASGTEGEASNGARGDGGPGAPPRSAREVWRGGRRGGEDLG